MALPPRESPDRDARASLNDRALILVLKDSDWTLPRLMRDRYLVIATRQQVDLSIYEHSSTLRGGEQLPWPIQEALLANPTRGGGRHEVSTQAGFGISYVDLWVE